jgi:hypothetical protein
MTHIPGHRQKPSVARPDPDPPGFFGNVLNPLRGRGLFAAPRIGREIIEDIQRRPASNLTPVGDYETFQAGQSLAKEGHPILGRAMSLLGSGSALATAVGMGSLSRRATPVAQRALTRWAAHLDDLEFHGTGQIGAERRRKSDPDYLDRNYFEPYGVAPEKRFEGQPVMHGEIDEGLIAPPEVMRQYHQVTGDPTQMETLMAAQGWEAYQAPNGAIAKFTDTPVVPETRPMTRRQTEAHFDVLEGEAPGSSFTASGDDMLGSGYYSVAVPPPAGRKDWVTLQPGEELTPDILDDFRATYADELATGNDRGVGTWTDPESGRTSIDVVEFAPDLEEAQLLAAEGGQDGIFHLTSQTDTQQLTITDRGEFIPTRRAPTEAEQIEQQGFTQEFLRENYPTPAEPELRFDNPKKPEGYLARGTNPENEAFWNARTAAQADIDQGNYTPFFDEAERYYAQGNPDLTQIPEPVREATRQKYVDMYNTPEVKERLRSAFGEAVDKPAAQDWYAMGQLEDQAIAELGVDEGTQWFRQKFADAMAATTAGSDPTTNLVRAAYSNYRLARGMPLPPTHMIPKPLTGRYIRGPLQTAEKARLAGGLNPKTQPKGYSFSGNFQGELDLATIDEQMMKAIDPGGPAAPPNTGYRAAADAVREVSETVGRQAAPGQGVMWAGIKGSEGMPMIRHVNEAIERTARLTGQTPDEVVRRWIREDAPLFGVGGLLAGSQLQRGREQK